MFLAGLPLLFEALASSVAGVAERLGEEFRSTPPSPSTAGDRRDGGRMGEFAGEAHALHRAAHAAELERIENPGRMRVCGMLSRISDQAGVTPVRRKPASVPRARRRALEIGLPVTAGVYARGHGAERVPAAAAGPGGRGPGPGAVLVVTAWSGASRTCAPLTRRRARGGCGVAGRGRLRPALGLAAAALLVLGAAVAVWTYPRIIEREQRAAEEARRAALGRPRPEGAAPVARPAGPHRAPGGAVAGREDTRPATWCTSSCRGRARLPTRAWPRRPRSWRWRPGCGTGPCASSAATRLTRSPCT